MFFYLGVIIVHICVDCTKILIEDFLVVFVDANKLFAFVLLRALSRKMWVTLPDVHTLM